MPKNSHFIFASVLLVSIATAANSQAVAPQAPPVNQVHMTATGATEVQQDVITITLRATKDGIDAAAVQAHLKSVVDTALQEGRIDAKVGQLSIRSGALGLYPRYGKDSKIVGWQGTGDVILDGRDLIKISKLAGRIQGMNISNVQFGLSPEENNLAQSTAQSMAISNFKGKAESITRQFGFTGYTLRDIVVSTGDGSQPRPQFMAMQMRGVSGIASDAPVPVEAGRTAVNVAVSGTIQMH